MIAEWIDWFTQIYNVEAVVSMGGLLGMTLIVFAETGLLAGFFLPGDSLLIAAGLLTARGTFETNVFVTCTVLSIAAVVGDTVGYWFGAKTGPHLFKREKSLLFNPKHLIRTHEFYEKHGGKTIIIARFVPIIRTFAPIVAGIGTMNYSRFISYNVFGGIGWVWSMVMLGYFLGTAFPWMIESIDKVIIVVIFISLLPMAIHYWVEKRKKPQEA
ncbi:MAG: Inner membrane protein YqjA [Candidatus Hinthialibacteria bacterium OLB16]|nr:MAG: Inner membrane protein YqjA [Candidatus Hinthialibacteria bacterium OLB16]MBK7497430.1 VTT domain-containing protein [Candidatus Omnitrophota bacterium]